MLTKEIIKDLESFKNPQRAEHSKRFFRTGKGEYGENDVFLGASLPQMRSLVKKYKKTATLKDIEPLFDGKFHEMRLCGFMLLKEMFRSAKTEENKKTFYDFYMAHLYAANNWDLVDVTAPHISGPYLYGKSHKPLLDLAKSGNLWRERVAIISTLYFIKRGNFETSLKLAEKYITHTHDLIQKASGWTLREIGKQDIKTLYAFLDKYAAIMPRTMLRYSLEKLPEEKRKYYMAAKANRAA